MERIKIIQQAPGFIWCVGWLFTLGYLKLGFWAGVGALFVWPYFLGSHLAG